MPIQDDLVFPLLKKLELLAANNRKRNPNWPTQNGNVLAHRIKSVRVGLASDMARFWPQNISSGLSFSLSTLLSILFPDALVSFSSSM